MQCRAACLVVCMSMLGLPGCAGPPIGPSPGMGDPYPAPINDPQISVLSADLRPWLAFHPARLEYDGKRPLQVEVPVRNMADRRYLVEYRILFFDAADLELRPTMGWRSAVLLPKQTVRLKAGALSPAATGYRLEVQWAAGT